jgi:hypothetical protein
MIIGFLNIFTFFHDHEDVSKSRDNTQDQKYEHTPRRCSQPPIQKKTDKKADHYGKGDHQSETAVISQVPKNLPGIIFHFIALRAKAKQLKDGSLPHEKPSVN